MAVPGEHVDRLFPIEVALAKRRLGSSFGTTRETGAVVAGMARVAAGRNRVKVSGVGAYSVLLSCVRRNAPPAAGSLTVSRQLALVPTSGGSRDEAASTVAVLRVHLFASGLSAHGGSVL